MNILICDDEAVFRQWLEQQVTREAQRLQMSVSVQAIAAPDEIVSAPLNEIDIAFLDIDLGKASGMELARRIRSANRNAVLIFVTNHIEYCLEGYEVQAFRYLLKQDIEQKLPPVFEQAAAAVKDAKKSIVLMSEGEAVDIRLRDLVYAETDGRYLLLHLTRGDRRLFRVKMTMHQFEKMVKLHGFLRLHASYIVNMAYIQKLQSGEVVLTNGKVLTISIHKYRELKQQYMQWRK